MASTKRNVPNIAETKKKGLGSRESHSAKRPSVMPALTNKRSAHHHLHQKIKLQSAIAFSSPATNGLVSGPASAEFQGVVSKFQDKTAAALQAVQQLPHAIMTNLC